MHQHERLDRYRRVVGDLAQKRCDGVGVVVGSMVRLARLGLGQFAFQPAPRSALSTARAATGYALATTAASARLAAATAQGAATVTRAVATATAKQTAVTAAQATTQAAAGAATHLPRRYVSALGSLADVGPRRGARRVWTRRGRAHVEVKGLTGRGERHRRIANDVVTALNRIEGVDWAQVNAATRQVLLAFDDDRVGVEDIVAVVQSVEEHHGTADLDFSDAEAGGTPEHPADEMPVAVMALALATDLAGLGAATVARAAHVRLLPRGARVPLLIADTQPRLREFIAARLGHQHAELLISIATSTVNAASVGPGPLAVDSVHHAVRLAERLSRQSVWHRREPELVRDGQALPAETHERTARPRPLPDGPIERLGERSSLASLLGAGGALAFTRDPGRAADFMLATMPKAGRHGREAFAAAFGWTLARGGVVPMDGTALRRLDRLDTVVIDSAVLCLPKPVVLSAEATAGGSKTGLDDAAVWQIAQRLITTANEGDGDAASQDPGPAQAALAEAALLGTAPSQDSVLWSDGRWRLRYTAPRAGRAPLSEQPSASQGPQSAEPGQLALDLLDASGKRRGRIRVGCALDPLADAVLAAAHAAADRVVLTRHSSINGLLQWADDLLPGDGELHNHVRRLQAEGHGVLVVSTADDAALAAADVGVAVLPPADGAMTGAVGWSGDLICGPGLAQVWRVLNAVPTARAVSERSSRLAWGGSALGALLATTGERHRGRGPGPRFSPVHSAAMIAVVGGAYTGLRIGHATRPRGTVHEPWHILPARDAYLRLREYRQEAERQAQQSRPSVPVRAAAGAARRIAATTPVRQLVVTPARGTAEFTGALAEELRDPLTPVLALGAAASAVVGSGVDAILVGGVMAGNAVISAGQQLRARRALRALMLGERPNARVVAWSGPGTGIAKHRAEGETDTAWTAGLTEAHSRIIPAQRLRVGDVIVLRASDIVPADARIIRAAELEVDESALTGESLPVPKSPAANPGAELADRGCMVYEGCTVVAGTGYAVVTAIGSDTEAGRAAVVAGDYASPRVGIQARLSELARIALPATGVGGAAVTGLALLRGVPLRQAVASGVAIAVAAVPEGLPLVATVAQLAAARRLSRFGVLVRSANTLEALGRVDTVCFDKTGTLTEGRLSVSRVSAFDQDLALDSRRGRDVLNTAACACPDVGGDPARTLVHPTDIAVVQAAREHAAEERQDWHLELELPFENTRGYSASLGERDGHKVLTVKGAPEVVLERCDGVATEAGRRKFTAQHRSTASRTLKRLADEGLRVLAVAETTAVGEGGGEAARDGAPAPEGLADQVRDLTLVGFVAIADTVREGARETIARLAAEGVRVIMITGDHPRTAVAIARQLGIPDAERLLTGSELDRLAKAQRESRIADSAVFARVSPQHKVRIVQALQRAGRVVAMTGDGSNDAAAIRLADVGIALAGKGTMPARNAADLVLSSPDPTRIVDALAEGKALWRSVRDAVSILVGGNAGEVAFTVLGTAVGGRAPLGTRQFLLVNMMTDMLPALAMALAPARPPSDGEASASRSQDGGALGPWAPALARDLAARGAATALGATLAWQAGRFTGRRRRASTMGLAALVGTQLGQTLVTGRHSPLVIGTCAASALALFAVVETPVLSRFFGCTPLGPAAWGIVGVSSVTATLAGSAAPALIRKFTERDAPVPAAAAA
jgi:cation-transporting ATPase I